MTNISSSPRLFQLVACKRYIRFFCSIALFFNAVTGFSQTVDFSYIAAGSVLCSSAGIQFAASASGSPFGYVWTFGNGASSNISFPNIAYTNPGNYTVKLTVLYEDTAISVTKVLTINQAVTVNIFPDRNYICRPGAITFTAPGNAGSGTYAWNFGDGSSTTTTVSGTTHNYAALGSYTATVTATSTVGCSATATVPVSVKLPALIASRSPQDGCVPAAVAFSASADIPANSTVSSYAWAFGDGSSTTTTGGNTTHVYTTAGGYNPSLVVTTSEGCTNTYNFTAVAFGTPPTNPIAYAAKDTICGSDSLVLVAKAGNANKYDWNFGDGTTAIVTDTTTRHKFKTPGSKTVSVTPYFNGCAGAVRTFRVFVKGVIAGYSYANTCSNKQTFSFADTSYGNVTSRRWTLGDGTSINNAPSFQHTYNIPGIYQSVLIVKDSVSGCADTLSNELYYAAPVLVSNDTLVCKGAPLVLTINGNYANADALYTWGVAGDTIGPASIDSVINFTAHHHGVFNNFVVIDNGTGYCKDTIRQAKPVRVRGIVASFTRNSDFCVYDSLQVTNTSHPYYPQDSIKLWYWNFGDSPVNDTVFQPAAHHYNRAGYFNVTLYAVDINGCRDSTSIAPFVRPIPFIRTVPRVDTLCLGQLTSLIAFHSDSVTWAPTALINCIKCDTITVSPSATTYFVASVTNPYQCTVSDSVLVKVFFPFQSATSFSDTAVCLKNSIRLQVLPPGKMVKWLPATGLSSATSYNPLVTVLQPLKYQAILTDSAGCFSDTASVTIKPISLPVVDAGPDRIYPFHALFNFEPTYSSNTVAYRWVPGTLLSCADCAIPTGRNDYAQIYTVTVTSDSGCVAKDSVYIHIDCKDANLLMPTAFTPDNNGLNDYYYPLTRGVATVKNFMIYNRVGQLVYQAKDFAPNNQHFGWDGRFNGNPQATGAYVYILEALCDAGQMLTRKGSFLLLK